MNKFGMALGDPLLKLSPDKLDNGANVRPHYRIFNGMSPNQFCGIATYKHAKEI